jgi:hypothetical protein
MYLLQTIYDGHAKHLAINELIKIKITCHLICICTSQCCMHRLSHLQYQMKWLYDFIDVDHSSILVEMVCQVRDLLQARGGVW